MHRHTGKGAIGKESKVQISRSVCYPEWALVISSASRSKCYSDTFPKMGCDPYLTVPFKYCQANALTV